MKDRIWKWIAIAAIGIIIADVGWKGWQTLKWKQSVDVLLVNLEQATDARVIGVEQRLTDLERAFVSVHPEFRQRPTPGQGQ